MSTRFNTDTTALNTRADLNAGRGRHDLEDWMLQFLPPLEGRHVVDLGCGSGKQIMRFAPMIGADGSILGLDASSQGVEEIRAKAAAAGYDWVSADQVLLDDAPDYLRDHRFDLVLSTYAIYYASDFVQLLKELGDRMGEGGEIFVSGPGAGTNREVADIIARLAPDRPREKVYIADFIDAAGVAALTTHFRDCEIHRLDNAIAFHSPGEVVAWWKNHNSYVPEIEAEVGEAIAAQFPQAGAWEMTKSVIGVHCRV